MEDSQIELKYVIQELKSSYNNQKLFLEELFKEILSFHENNLNKIIKELSILIEELGIPFVLIFNREINYLEKIACIFYEYESCRESIF